MLLISSLRIVACRVASSRNSSSIQNRCPFAWDLQRGMEGRTIAMQFTKHLACQTWTCATAQNVCFTCHAYHAVRGWHGTCSIPFSHCMQLPYGEEGAHMGSGTLGHASWKKAVLALMQIMRVCVTIPPEYPWRNLPPSPPRSEITCPIVPFVRVQDSLEFTNVKTF